MLFNSNHHHDALEQSLSRDLSEIKGLPDFLVLIKDMNKEMDIWTLIFLDWFAADRQLA